MVKKKKEKILTLDVAEQVGADEGEEEHGDGQGAVGQHLPHFGVQEWAGAGWRGERETEVRLSGGRAVIAEWDDRAQGKRSGCEAGST